MGNNCPNTLKYIEQLENENLMLKSEILSLRKRLLLVYQNNNAQAFEKDVKMQDCLMQENSRLKKELAELRLKILIKRI